MTEVHYLWEHDSLTPRVATVADAQAFCAGEPRWVREYPVEVVAQQEPEYWQWRLKGQPWSLQYTFNSRPAVTTDDSEARALYTAPQPSQQTEALMELQEDRDGLRHALEVIAVGDSEDPVRDAGDALVELGHWRAEAVAEIRAAAPQPSAERKRLVIEALRIAQTYAEDTVRENWKTAGDTFDKLRDVLHRLAASEPKPQESAEATCPISHRDAAVTKWQETLGELWAKNDRIAELEAALAARPPQPAAESRDALREEAKRLHRRRSAIVCGINTARACDKLDAELDAMIDRIAASPAPDLTERARLPDGWTFNEARVAEDHEAGDGVWQIGCRNEEDTFSPIITVDTGLYFQPDDAEPMARAILARLAAPRGSQDAGEAEPATCKAGLLVATPSAARQAVAEVPIHPRTGPLWANTVAIGKRHGELPHYEWRSLIFAAPSGTIGEAQGATPSASPDR